MLSDMYLVYGTYLSLWAEMSQNSAYSEGIIGSKCFVKWDVITVHLYKSADAPCHKDASSVPDEETEYACIPENVPVLDETEASETSLPSQGLGKVNIFTCCWKYL